MSKYDMYVEDVSVEAVFNELGGVEGARAFLRGEQKLVPRPFERNEHGHIVFTVTGRNLAGEQEVVCRTATGFGAIDGVKSCLLSTRKDGYFKTRRLDAGQQYQIAFVPTKDVGGRYTTAEGREYGSSFRYEQLLPGAVPRIRELVSDEQMKEMGFKYIAAPHDPIKDSFGAFVLGAYRNDGGRWLDVCSGHHDYRWDNSGAFAFFDPTGTPTKASV